jgi:RHS repeat-associated protein
VVLLGRQAGFCEYDRHTDQWNSFRPFLSAPNLDVAGANTQLLDINGNGRPDILVSRHDCYTLYPLEGKEGFGEPVEFAKPQTAGAKQPQTIAENPELDLFFANMTGDGLLDQVRIQNGRVEYWPQIGHGRFGDVILMENAPIFDFDTEFDPGRLRLVDIDGSGTTDILYIGRGEVRYWINACGNSFIEGGQLTNLPYIDNLSTVSVLDFLGDGTPCLVWSSALPGNAGDPIHYLQLTSGVKPRLLLSIDNSMGRQDILTYSSSGTHFLRDKNNGRKWISRLPSHTTVVDKKEVIDQIGNSCFVSRYEYHDGYFDGEERIFRGFGMVEQYDSEFFENTQNIDEADYSAPVCIRSWYHNGMFGWDTRRAELYYSNDPDQNFLPTHTFEDLAILKPKEFDDGFRCLAGQMVRQEVFASSPEGMLSDHPYQVTQSTYTIRRLQPSTDKDDACFTFHMSETLTHEYDRQPQDPRITHQLVLDVDPYGNTRSACSIAYPRRSTISDRALAQQLYYINASCNEYIKIDETDRYEVGLPFENREFELSDISPGETGIFSLDEVKTGIDAALESPLDFNETFAPVSSSPQARIIAWNRIYFWNNGMTEPLSLGRVGAKTLLHHEESACFNAALISDIFNARIDPDSLSDFYYEFKDGYWWQLGPVLHYHSADGFYNFSLEVSADGGETQYTYDEPYFLTLTEIRDALGNRTSAEIDYNVVAPFLITDPNDNISEVLYDPLGAVMVSTSQGSILGPLDSPEIYGNDRLTEYTLQPDSDFSAILAEPSRFLQNAGQFVYYELNSWSESEPGQPLRSIFLVREENVHDGAGGGALDSRIRISVSYADGFGRALQSKQKVEPGLVIRRDDSGAVVLDSDGRPEEEHSDERWLVSGHTVYNNKQQPVRQYEPFFSSTPLFEPDSELRHYGVSDHLRYDSIGRMIRQDLPNGTFSRIETTPWEIRTYDPNDTVDDSEYRVGRETLPDGDQEKKALLKALVHADTPSIVRLDPLGREIIQVETDMDGSPRITESRLDIQGNVTSITDPRDLAAFTYCYDMQGRLFFEHSIDAGDKWIFLDALERPVHQWDGHGVHQEFEYDRLGRPVSVFADGVPGLNQVVERMAYDEDGSGLPAEIQNSRGRLVTHYDQAGIQNIIKYSPEGNPLKTERQLFEKQLLEKYSSEPDWTDIPSVSFDPDGVFTTETVYDALGRVTEQRPPDGTTRTTEYLPGGGIASVRVTTADGVLSNAEFLREAAYNARGQRTGAVLGNDVEISYVYDPLTFRMNRLTSVLPASAPGGPKTLQDIEYTYDPVGNIVHFVDNAQQPEPVHSDIMQGLHVSSHCEFTYDAFYQLEEATGRVHQALRQHDYRSDPLIENAIKGTRHLHLNNGAAVERYRRTYGYDLSGNIQYINHAGLGAGADSCSWNTEIWSSPSSNRSLPLNDVNGIPVTNPETRFDANGNNIYMPHMRRIDWNYRNNISCAVIIDRSEEGLLDDAEHYVYGGDGMRVRKIMENLTNREEGTVEVTEKIYLDGCEIKRIHRNDTLILERISSHISDGTNRIAILHQWNEDASSRETEDISEKKTHYQLSNHLGSSSLEINEHRDVISYEEYFPFGGTAFIAGDRVKEVKLKEYRYSGKERDDATGFYYYGYRYYAPWIGNWLSPDPIGPEDSLNLYMFVGNNPVNLVDPDGLGDEDEEEFQRALERLRECRPDSPCTIEEGGHIYQYQQTTEGLMFGRVEPGGQRIDSVVVEEEMVIGRIRRPRPQQQTPDEPESPEPPPEPETSPEPESPPEPETSPEPEMPSEPEASPEPAGRRMPLEPGEQGAPPSMLVRTPSGRRIVASRVRARGEAARRRQQYENPLVIEQIPMERPRRGPTISSMGEAEAREIMLGPPQRDPGDPAAQSWERHQPLWGSWMASVFYSFSRTVNPNDPAAHEASMQLGQIAESALPGGRTNIHVPNAPQAGRVISIDTRRGSNQIGGPHRGGWWGYSGHGIRRSSRSFKTRSHIGSAGRSTTPSTPLNPEAESEVCVPSIAAMINRIEGRRHLRTAQDIQENYGHVLGREGSRVPGRLEALRYIERATGLRLTRINRTPIEESGVSIPRGMAGIEVARLPGHYAIFVGERHVAYARVRSDGSHVIVDPIVRRRAFSSFSEYREYLREHGLFGTAPTFRTHYLGPVRGQ